MNEIEHQTTTSSAFLEQILADLRVLVEEIGIRFAGTPGDESAAQYIAGRMIQTGLKPQQNPFRIMGWSLRDETRLEISAAGTPPWEVMAFPYAYSSSTPVHGYRGRLIYGGRQELMRLEKFRPFERDKFRFRKYAILDEKEDIVAYIVSRDFPDGAAAAPWGALSLPMTTPTVMIGEQDGRRLEELIASGRTIEASLCLSAEFNPDAVTRNITACLPGSDTRKSRQQILVAAHYDTQYTSPGAVDDGSGVASLLALCRYFQENPPRHSLLFAAYGGEEIGLVGSSHHFARLMAGEDLSAIRAVVNLDMVACNEPTWIHASEDFLAQECVRRAARDIRIEEKYGWLEIVTPPWPSGDQDPFYDHGIPCVLFTWKGYRYPSGLSPILA